jgi:hypothetical protein
MGDEGRPIFLHKPRIHLHDESVKRYIKQGDEFSGTQIAFDMADERQSGGAFGHQ